MPSDILWKLGGRTGEGIESAGELLARAAKNDGRYANTFREFPSVIKGGYTSCEVRLANWPASARGDTVDICIALDAEAVRRIAPELTEGGLLLYDAVIPPDRLPTPHSPGQRWLAVPLTDLARQQGDRITRNMVALGMSARILHIDLELLKVAVERKFADKGERVLAGNLKAVEAGWQHAERLDLDLPVGRASLPDDMVLASGNDALAFGALSAGCRLFAGYPITPASGVLEFLAEHLPRFGGAVVQAEDEIAALLMVTGAFYAGTRALTATSGPGISLMTEAFGLPAMTETPAVIIDEQRPGPSSGMPTKHEQGDLTHVIFSSHGDAPRIVLSPNSVEECFDLVGRAFYLAEKYQCPVFVLVDQDLALRTQTVPRFRLDPSVLERQSLLAPHELAALGPGGYLRYRDTETGISPRTLPGQPGGLFLASGDEHHEDGRIDVELPAVRKAAMEKRMRKLWGLGRELPALRLTDQNGSRLEIWDTPPDEGSDGTTGEPMAGVDEEPAQNLGEPYDLAILSFGSTDLAVQEILPEIRDSGYSVRHLEFRYLWPFPAGALNRALDSARRVVVVEQNYSGQLLLLVKAHYARHDRLHSIRKYDGLPFRPKELLDCLTEVMPAWPEVRNS